MGHITKDTKRIGNVRNVIKHGESRHQYDDRPCGNIIIILSHGRSSIVSSITQQYISSVTKLANAG
jgi:hypothetical protein